MSNHFARWLAPRRTCTAILMRHAERGHFSHPAAGALVPITENGAVEATRLGRSLASCGPLDFVHSPVGRCRQTAEAMLAGAREPGASVTLTGEEPKLGGPYMLDVPAALDLAGQFGHRFLREWFDGRLPVHLFKPRRHAAREQIETVESHMGRAGRGLVVLVTHDWNLLAVREELFGLRHEVDAWPGFLDGLVFWRGSAGLRVAAGDRVVTYFKDQCR